ncbi:putative cytochrome-c peroxidase [Bradyrhizobium japonicum SEMIA 5079]|nr:putative cytochrome-c peroxidase [Bradyrhizobium japonicum SEMIA 5079]
MRFSGKTGLIPIPIDRARAPCVPAGASAAMRCPLMMRATSLVILLLLSNIFAVVAPRAQEKDAGVGAPPALAPGQAPPLPKPGPLAEPRSSTQVGFPTVLTEYVISPSTLRPARVALGQKLFFEPRLSGDGTVSCATCHDPARAFTDGRPLAVGIHGRVGQRNAPTVLNALYNKTQFWDGRVDTLEQQAALPITNPFEMGSASIGDALSRIAGDKDYQGQFMQAFGRDVNEQDMLSAIAAYERTLASFDSPFDHFIAGDGNAISDSARRGWDLFNAKARCHLCHALTDNQPDATLFLDSDFHNVGIGILRHHVVPLAQQAERELAKGHVTGIDTAAITSEMSVLGRFLVTRKQDDIASFKTPGLRNVLVTGPYFHDGSMQTLWDVMDHYNKGDGITNPWLDKDMQPLALTEPEIDDMVAFLASLTSAQYKVTGDQEYARQLALSKVNRPQRDTARAFGPKPKQPEPPPL